MFHEQVGFVEGYKREIVNGDLRDPELWRDLEDRYQLSKSDPAFVLGSGDDGTNIHTALWLQNKYPSAYVVARGFRRSTFANEVSREGDQFPVTASIDGVSRVTRLCSVLRGVASALWPWQLPRCDRAGLRWSPVPRVAHWSLC